MCGIAGLWNRRGVVKGEIGAIASEMANRIHLRGPDDSGVWVDEPAGFALSHRRLSIIDLSPLGHQPMTSATGRYVVTFNGEIYNYEQLRDLLGALGHRFRGHSDTEVMLAAFDEWGVGDTLPRLNGMFAMAIVDRNEEILYFARDRFGEKPLYYSVLGDGSVVFGSELKALHAHPAFAPALDRTALTAYFEHSCVPSPLCIFEGVKKLPPASYATCTRDGDPVVRTYYDFAVVVSRPRVALSEEDAVDRLEELLTTAVDMRRMSDVPLGAFLSGGFDSTAIVALMQRRSTSRIRTFTIGYEEAAYDESPHARRVADYLGTDHTELRLTSADSMAVIPRLSKIYDEPFADSSQIPTFSVSELARRHVTVCLSGDAGDEVFGGYNRHALVKSVLGWARPIPLPVRRRLAETVLGIPIASLDRFIARFGRMAPAVSRQRFGEKAHKLAGVFASAGVMDAYSRVSRHWSGAPPVLHPESSSVRPSVHLTDPTEIMMYLDTVTYLPDDILAKVDRASMAVSLEVRVPFLDPNVVEFAWSLPLSHKVQGRVGKRILKKLVGRHVPMAMLERPKTGFGVPIDAWIRGPLRDWASDLLNAKRMREEGNLDVDAIGRKWKEHLDGARNWQHELWDVLMFQSWLRNAREAA